MLRRFRWFLLFCSPGGSAPRTLHPGSQGSYITHIPNIIWTVRSIYYPYHKHYMDRTVHIGQHTREYGPYGPYIAQYSKIYGPYGPYLAQHTRKYGSYGPYMAQHSRKLSKIRKLNFLLKTNQDFSNGHIYNFHVSKIPNLEKIK